MSTNNLDLNVFNALLAWLAEGQQAWLCTVTQTWGSAPREVGSLMACNAAGQQVGSLSGGCIEEDLLASVACGQVSAIVASHIIYGATKEEAERLKLPCGGTLGVLIEPLTPADLPWLHQVTDQITRRQCVTRDVEWQQGRANMALNAGAHRDWFRFVRHEQEPQHLHQVYGPQFHLFLIGVSEVSRALARFALQMDYRVTVCDPRPEQIAQWDVENATTLRAMPDDAVLAHANDERAAVVALTHDPRIDDMGLLEAFNTKAFYIGAMGSVPTSTKRRERLLSLGIAGADLDRLHAPIGISIGSKTPAEIAISILAELTQVRAAAKTATRLAASCDISA